MTEEERREIKNKIIVYAEAGVYRITKKEQADFKWLVQEHEDIAEEVYRETHLSRVHILIFLNEAGKGAGIAKEEARKLAYGYELLDCDAGTEQAFWAWLSGDTDEMPKQMPESRRTVMYNVSILNQKLCYMSKVSPFTERLCAYAVKKGYVDIWKNPVEEMLSCIGMDYTRSFKHNMAVRYQVEEKELMRMYSAVFAGRKTKMEKEFYLGFIKEWMEKEKDSYLAVIDKMGVEYRKKIRMALQKEALPG